jgi:hypothetical protein
VALAAINKHKAPDEVSLSLAQLLPGLSALLAVNTIAEPSVISEHNCQMRPECLSVHA